MITVKLNGMLSAQRLPFKRFSTVLYGGGFMCVSFFRCSCLLTHHLQTPPLTVLRDYHAAPSLGPYAQSLHSLGRAPLVCKRQAPPAPAKNPPGESRKSLGWPAERGDSPSRREGPRFRKQEGNNHREGEMPERVKIEIYERASEKGWGIA